MWAQVGFVQSSIGLPRKLQDRITLAKKVSDFLATNPSYEVASQGITAAQGVIVRKAVIDAQTPLLQADMDLKTDLGTLNTSQAALVKSMRYVIKILSGAREERPGMGGLWPEYAGDADDAGRTDGSAGNIDGHAGPAAMRRDAAGDALSLPHEDRGRRRRTTNWPPARTSRRRR